MSGINLDKISPLISQKLGRKIELVKCEKIGSGYHSDGYKLSSKNNEDFFIKRVKSHDFGFEFPERKIASLMVSNGMGQRAAIAPEPIGVILENPGEAVILPEIGEETAIYHLQHFSPVGESYWSRLQNRKQKSSFDKEDETELEKIINYIIAVHKIKHPSADKNRLAAVYADGLRSVVTNPELTITLLQDFPSDHELLPCNKHGEYIGLMLSVVRAWAPRAERMTALHGDFWGANLFFNERGEISVIDYSRIPWGDPGIDVGWWLSQYLWFYHETKNKYFVELGEKFLELYETKTGDKEIRGAAALPLGLMGVIYTSPRFYPDLDMNVARNFINTILEILKRNTFIWEI